MPIVSGKVTLPTTANYVFNGTTGNQTSGSAFPTTVNNLTINNTGSSGNNTVTIPATAINGLLYVESGLLSFGGTTSSMAGVLTFDGSTGQAPGTWGSSSSSALHQDNTHFAGSGYVTVSGFTVTYDGNGNDGGTAPSAVNGNYHTSILLAGPGTLSRTGYTFANWNTAADGTGTSYHAGASFTIPAANTTLYAQWTFGLDSSVTISGIADTTLSYTGGAGSQFVLLSSGSLGVQPADWTREQTNSATPGTFTIPAVGTSLRRFYLIKSE